MIRIQIKKINKESEIEGFVQNQGKNLFFGKGAFLQKKQILLLSILVFYFIPLLSISFHDKKLNLGKLSPSQVKKIVLSGTDINEKDIHGNTPLIKACQITNNLETITMMITQGAKLNDKNDAGETALFVALANNRDVKIIELLLKYGAKTNEQYKNGMTALMEAGRSVNNPEVVKLLIKAGAKTNHRDKFGMTALMYASCYSPNPLIVKCLLDLGADGSIKCNRDLTAFDYVDEKPNVALRNSKVFDQLRDSQQKRYPNMRNKKHLLSP